MIKSQTAQKATALPPTQRTMKHRDTIASMPVMPAWACGEPHDSGTELIGEFEIVEKAAVPA
jgi:hypothetical protein